MISKGQQRCGVAIRTEQDVAAGSTVATVGSTLGDVRFSSERHRAGTTVTTAEVDLHLVDERGLGHGLRIRSVSALGSTNARRTQRTKPSGLIETGGAKRKKR
jgi:hypothetical protein